MSKFFGLFKLGILALVNEAEEQIVGQKLGPQRKAWVREKLLKLLKDAGLYGVKVFGLFSLDQLLDAAVDALIEWGAAQLKKGFDALEKL